MYVIVVESEVPEGHKSPTFCARKNRSIPEGFVNAGSRYTTNEQVLQALVTLGTTQVCLDYLVEDQKLYAFLHRRLKKAGVVIRGVDPLSVDWDPQIIAMALGYDYDELAVPTHRFLLDGHGELCRRNGQARDLQNPKWQKLNTVGVLKNLMRLSGSEFGLALELSNNVFGNHVLCSVGPETLRDWPVISATEPWVLPRSRDFTKCIEVLLEDPPKRLENTQDLRDQMWTAEYLEVDPEYPQELVWESPSEFRDCAIWGYLYQGLPVAFAAVHNTVLRNVRVLPSFRGHALGAHLVNHVVQHCGVRNLQCRASLVPWYEELGFRKMNGKPASPVFQRMVRK